MARDSEERHAEQINAMAGSLWQAACHARMGVTKETFEIKPWDSLGHEDQAPFLKVAVRGPKAIEQLEGQVMPVVAFRMFALTIDDSQEMAISLWRDSDPLLWIMWEAIARHLAFLVDSDELPSNDSSEERWGSWAAAKLERL